MTSPFDEEEVDKADHDSGERHRDESADRRVEQLLIGLTPRSTPHVVRELVLAELRNVAHETVCLAHAKWRSALDYSLTALVLVTVMAWVTSASLHSQRMRELLGPTSAERRAQRDVRSLDALVSEESVRGMQAQLTTLYKQVQRSRGSSQTVHSPSIELLPDFWRNKNAEAHHQDSHRPSGNSSTRRSPMDLEVQRSA